MKAFTDLEQSKELAKILPITSIDFAWNIFSDGSTRLLRMDDWEVSENAKSNVEIIPCWSLVALIDILPADWWGYNEHYFLEISKNGDNSKPNKVCYYRFRKDIDGANYDRIPHISHTAENLIDACVNMIITLYEHKLLKEH